MEWCRSTGCTFCVSPTKMSHLLHRALAGLRGSPLVHRDRSHRQFLALRSRGSGREQQSTLRLPLERPPPPRGSAGAADDDRGSAHFRTQGFCGFEAQTDDRRCDGGIVSCRADRVLDGMAQHREHGSRGRKRSEVGHRGQMPDRTKAYSQLRSMTTMPDVRRGH